MNTTKTLHDEYTMAALTGLLAYNHENYPIEIAVSYARAYADEAMKQRAAGVAHGTHAG